MKKLLLLTGLTLALALNATATIFYQGNLGAYTGDSSQGAVAFGAIADGNAVGTVNQMNLSGAAQGTELTSINVILNLSGGYNGDLYGYLSYNGVAVVLLNRVGVGAGTPFGNSGSSINIQLSDAASANVHLAANGLVNQSYNVDNNQTVSPVANAVAFTGAAPGSLNSSFGSFNPNGTWTLYLADVSGGGGTTTLLGWGLDISAVPEPTTWALLAFLAVAGGVGWMRRRRAQA